MSQRPPVDRARIQGFLHELGARFRKSGRLFLVGGTTVVYEQLRPQTVDVDIAAEIAVDDYAEFIQVVRQLKDELGINVEEASPADFIPLPSGYSDRARYVGRYGHLDVFHFDLYSVALSKIERGRDADFEDVLALLRAKWIEFDALGRFFEEILPLMSERSLRADPDEFRRKFEHLSKTWKSG